jgi:hypothetical protein
MTTEDMSDGSHTSRRRVLKAMGVGTVAAWAVPTVISFESVAAAASGTCVSFVCGGPVCSNNCPNPVGDNVAACFQRADSLPGDCVPDFFCNNPPCTTNTDCPSGWVCFVNTCCGPQGVCAPLACLPPVSAPRSKQAGRSAAIPAPVG